MLYNIIVATLGLVVSRFLLAYFPTLKRKDIRKPDYSISVVIPARNEAINIGLLLSDLKSQSIEIDEIICVDDCSIDQTYRVASSFDIKVISIEDKPDDWTGKAWACQVGGQAARGDIIIFLDADVRLSVNAISSLIHTYDVDKCVISLQPYHRTEKLYEQFSFFFNIVQIAANGVSQRCYAKSVGLYGPVILIDRDTYISIDRHESAKKSVVDDLAIGERLKKRGFDFKLYLGDRDIFFRMYGNDFKSLFLGWTKNYATGAFKTPAFTLVLNFLWVTSSISTVILLIKSISSGDTVYMMMGILLYTLWVLELFRISFRIGKFKASTVILFPITLAFFVLVFAVSLIKRVFKREVTWKDRKIRLDK